ncbi:MAG: hypothetical protein IJY60_07955 [Bacteroides sp.]|nr:hypothetical protein [Bacteroides sp.]
MKTTLKLKTLLLALASVFAFSSCLDDSEDSSGPAYFSYVTIAGDQLFGYKFYADNGAILIPTTTSVEQVLPGLKNSNVKRAFVSFDVINAPADGFLKPNETYQIELGSSYYSNYAIPTYQTILSFEPTDSLHTDNQVINNVNNNIWAANGYVNAQMTLNYEQSKTFYLNTYYTEEDINVDNNTFNLNLYYNSKSNNPYDQGTSVFSFRLPEDAAFHYQTDSINLILNAITNYGDKQLTKVGECKMAVKDFYAPMY